MNPGCTCDPCQETLAAMPGLGRFALICCVVLTPLAYWIFS